MATVLTPIQLEEIKNSFLEKWKEYDRNYRSWFDRKGGRIGRNIQVAEVLTLIGREPQLPEYYPGYRLAVEMMEQIEVHASKGKFPEKLFLSRSPNETDAEYLYRRANYKNTTRPIWQDYLATVSRANADQNWSFSTDDERLKDYIYNYPRYGTIDAFLKSVLTPIKEKDANGIIAVEPLKVQLKTDVEGNVMIVDDVAQIADEQIEPVPVYYSAKNVVGQEIGEWYMVIADEKSEVTFQGKVVKDGLVCYIFDSENIYQFRQIGKRINYEFTPVLVRYPHGLGYVPCQKLKGDLSIYEDQMIWISPFSSATDLLDLALLNESNLFVVLATTVYNYKVAIGTPCTFERDGNACAEGRILDINASGDIPKYDTCPACLGAGLRPRMSPFGVLLINPGGGLNESGDSAIHGDYLKLVGPPTEAPKLLREEIKGLEYRARKILHLPDADSSVTGDEGRTATGSLSKARSTTAFIEPIATQRFEILDFILNTTNQMMFLDPQEYTLEYPKTFDIETPSDYLAMIAQLQEQGAPPLLVNSYIQKFFSSLMYTNKQTEGAYKLLLREDLLLTMTREDINLRIAAETIEPWRDTLHQAGIQILTILLIENERFFDQDYKLQAEQLINKAKEFTVTNTLANPQQVAEESLRRVAELGV